MLKKFALLIALISPGLAFAQGTDLSCPVGFQVVQGPYTTTLNPATGARRINFCLDPTTGHLLYQGDGGGGVDSAVLLSVNCASSSAPCIQLPPSGGCVGNLSVTNGSKIVTFNGSFPTNAAPATATRS